MIDFDLIQTFLNTPASVIALVLGAAGVSALTEVIKKLSNMESERVIMVLFITVSALASALDYVISATNLPPTILGLNTALIVGVATPLYRFVIKPLSKFLSEFKTWRKEINNKVAEVEAINKVSSIDTPVLTEVNENKAGEDIKATVNVPLPIPAAESQLDSPSTPARTTF